MSTGNVGELKIRSSFLLRIYVVVFDMPWTVLGRLKEQPT